jgi:ActR/RegA family two-component response regulator
MGSANAPAPFANLGGVLLVSGDAVTIKQVGESMRQLAMSPEVCADVPTALAVLNRQKFEAVVVDLQLGGQANAVLEKVRVSPANRTAVLFAISASDEETAGAFKDGSNFVFRRPLSYTSIDRTLKVAYGLIVRERRRYFRCPLGIAVVICRPKIANVHGQCVNISEGGMAFQSSVAFETGTDVWVQYTLPDHDSAFAVGSTICWSSNNLVGLQFASPSPKQIADLQEWLARRLEESFPEFVAAKFRNLGQASPRMDELSGGAEFSAAEAGLSSSQDWVALSQAALSEPDAEKRLLKIETAKRIVRERWRELVSMGAGDGEERQRLSDAFEKMSR